MPEIISFCVVRSLIHYLDETISKIIPQVLLVRHSISMLNAERSFPNCSDQWFPNIWWQAPFWPRENVCSPHHSAKALVTLIYYLQYNISFKEVPISCCIAFLICFILYFLNKLFLFVRLNSYTFSCLCHQLVKIKYFISLTFCVWSEFLFKTCKNFTLGDQSIQCPC